MGLNHGTNIPTNGLVLLLDASSRRSTLRAAQSSNILTDPHSWTEGTGSFTGYGANGSATEQLRTTITDDPWGGRSVIWRTTPDATSGADGGWNTSTYSINRNFTYRWSIWVRRHTAGVGGTFYMGMNPSPIRNDNGAVQSNPYFTYPAISALTQNQWYLVVGHCFYEGYDGGTRHPDSGWYEKTATGGVRIADKSYGNVGTQDVRWQATTNGALHRVYHYYTTNTASGLEFAYPRLDKCDGTEPTIDELLTTGESKWRDLSGNGNDGIVQSQTDVTWTTQDGGVMDFNGSTTGSWITCTGPNLTTSDYTVIGISRYMTAQRGRFISANANNWLMGHWSNGSERHYANGWVTASSGGANDTFWRVYAATGRLSTDQFSFWVNGTKVVNNSTGGANGPNGFQLGRYYANTTEFTNGELMYLSAYNRVLSDNEIKNVTAALRKRVNV